MLIILKIYKYTCVVGFCIELKPIFFKAFTIIRGVSYFNWLISPCNSIFSAELLSSASLKRSTKSSFSFKQSAWHRLLHWLDELGPYTSLGLTLAPMPSTRPRVGGPITSKNIWLSSDHRPNFDGWSCLTKYWPSFVNFDYSFFTICSSNWCHTSPTPMSHHILPIQRLDFGFESRALWTYVIVPTHQEIVIWHVLLIQPFDWAQNSSKPIFYHTFSIQWPNFKSDYGTRWMCVISAYNETLITKNIQYTDKTWKPRKS